MLLPVRLSTTEIEALGYTLRDSLPTFAEAHRRCQSLTAQGFQIFYPLPFTNNHWRVYVRQRTNHTPSGDPHNELN